MVGDFLSDARALSLSVVYYSDLVLRPATTPSRSRGGVVWTRLDIETWVPARTYALGLHHRVERVREMDSNAPSVEGQGTVIAVSFICVPV